MLEQQESGNIPAHRRDQLERLIRYTARGAISLERLEQDEGGDFIYTFTQAWSDGTTGIKLSPLEWLEKWTALVPPPRVHQVRYGGCLAAHSKLRSAITPSPRQQGAPEASRPSSSRWGWARLLKRVFTLDMERCPRCQLGALRIIAAITSPPIIRRILRHLKLAADPPLIAPARLEQVPSLSKSPARIDDLVPKQGGVGSARCDPVAPLMTRGAEEGRLGCNLRPPRSI